MIVIDDMRGTTSAHRHCNLQSHESNAHVRATKFSLYIIAPEGTYRMRETIGQDTRRVERYFAYLPLQYSVHELFLFLIDQLYTEKSIDVLHHYRINTRQYSVICTEYIEDK